MMKYSFCFFLLIIFFSCGKTDTNTNTNNHKMTAVINGVVWNCDTVLIQNADSSYQINSITGIANGQKIELDVNAFPQLSNTINFRPAGVNGAIAFSSLKGTIVSSGIVQIDWMATNTNLHFFEVERSVDGTSFTTIGNVQPKANDGSQQPYSFLDNNALNGTTYYRIKATDNTGGVFYSNLIKVNTLHPGTRAYYNLVAGYNGTLYYNNDTVNNKLTGTFSFDVNYMGTIMHVTNGSFNIGY
ncbi:hypothetical protein [Ferruginibacter albus]|uniref:hypothetical protein n=1 Tax=Ferruginibacter albus TaxID=2875540 RepID=UPI001CC439DA|nr:hypothetical protein [Ferruginibacter albus]UAY52552.1 hypothetical protein K9M53_02400 [Ferruginibacter albus]